MQLTMNNTYLIYINLNLPKYIFIKKKKKTLKITLAIALWTNKIQYNNQKILIRIILKCEKKKKSL